jgi:ubiquitin-conjugating enzyme E2 D/E
VLRTEFFLLVLPAFDSIRMENHQNYIIMALKRIKKEFKDLLRDRPTDFCGGPISEADMFNWQATILGPEGSPYAGGLFRLKVQFPAEYPFRPPHLQFTTRIYHPKVNESGYFILPMVNNWEPSLNIAGLLREVHSLLVDVTDDDALNSVATHFYRTDRPNFDRTAREWTQNFAVV